jgi:hypothetical protein
MSLYLTKHRAVKTLHAFLTSALDGRLNRVDIRPPTIG